MSFLRSETNRLSVDDARILPRLRAQGPFLERRVMERNQAQALAAALENENARMPRLVKAEPGDLRGIPCLAKGVGGAVKGTSPHLVMFV